MDRTAKFIASFFILFLISGRASDLLIAAEPANLPLLQSLEPTSQIQQFLINNELEPYLDLAQVERERRIVFTILKKRLSAEESERFTSSTLAYKSGEIGFSDYHKIFKSHLQKNGIEIGRFPSFQRYLRYLLIIEGSRMYPAYS